MQFLADMGIALDVITALRASGHDALHLRERGLHRMVDDDILALAGQESRIILTHDLDFGRILAHSGATGPSVVTFRLANMAPVSVLSRLYMVLETFSEELARGCAITVTESAIRCRILPMLGPSGQGEGGGVDAPGAR